MNKKRGSARDHERDIVKYRPYSSFVDKWIFMLINWDSNMSENCGECGIALSIRPYTGINVASSVCGLLLSYRKVFFFVIWVSTFSLEPHSLLMPQMCITHGAICYTSTVIVLSVLKHHLFSVTGKNTFNPQSGFFFFYITMDYFFSSLNWIGIIMSMTFSYPLVKVFETLFIDF